MTRRDYINEMTEAIKDYIREEIENGSIENDDITQYRGALEEKLHDDLWVNDSVTGNASGSYTMSTYKAEENLAHAWDLIEEVAEGFGIDPVIKAGYEHGAEWWDVTIRCYLLGEAISEALDEIEEEIEEHEEQQELVRYAQEHREEAKEHETVAAV